MPETGRREVLAALLGVAAAPLRGKEKWSLIPISDAIICGRMERIWRLPWFDGWHMWGTLRVERVLRGAVPERAELAYRFVCSQCSISNVWQLHPDHFKLSIWYLRKETNGLWTSAESPDGMGQRPIGDLPALIEVLRRPGAG